MGKYCFGVDVGGTTVKLGLFNTDGDLLEKWEIPTVTDNHGAKILPDVANSILKKMDEREMERDDVEGVGIGAPGPIDSEGTVYGAVNLGWGTFSIKKELQSLLNMPVEAGNDANVAALGEMWQGGAKGYKNVILATLGTGVGSGIISRGKILSGLRGGAGEAGHMLLVLDGEPCTCGRRGCWEAYASATALIRQTRQAALAHPESLLAQVEEITGRTAFDAAQQGDATAAEVVARYAVYVAAGLTDFVNILAPEMILLGGGISRQGEVLLAPIREYVATHCFGQREGAIPTIAAAKLGNEAGIIGAAAL